MQRHLALLVLACAHVQRVVVEVDVVAVERERFAGPQAGGGDQCDQRLERGCVKRWVSVSVARINAAISAGE